MLRMAALLLPVALLSSGCAAAVDDAAPSSTSVPAAAAEAAPASVDETDVHSSPVPVILAEDAPAGARALEPIVATALRELDLVTLERVILRRPFDPLARSMDAAQTAPDIWLTLVVSADPGSDGSGWPLIGWEAARLYARIRVQAAAAGLPGPLGYNTALAGDSLDSGDRPLPSLEAAGAARAVPDEATVSRAVAAVGFDLVSYAGPAADGAVALEVRAPDGSPAEVIARWPEAFTAALGDGDGTWLLRLEGPDGDWVKVLWQEPLTTVRGGVTRPGLVDPGVVA